MKKLAILCLISLCSCTQEIIEKGPPGPTGPIGEAGASGMSEIVDANIYCINDASPQWCGNPGCTNLFIDINNCGFCGNKCQAPYNDCFQGNCISASSEGQSCATTMCASGLICELLGVGQTCEPQIK